MAKLSDRIKSLRLSANMTQEEFGKKFGIVKSTVSLYESGKSTPNDQIKKQICDYFDTSLDYLLGLSDKRHPDESGEWSYPKVSNRLGNILQDYRHKNNLSEDNFAKELNINVKTYIGIEIGKYSPSIPLLQRISKVTGYDIDYLTGAKSQTSIISNETFEVNGKKFPMSHFESNNHFHARLEEYCLKKKITDENVENFLCLTKQEFLDIRFNRMPTLSELLRISYGLDVSLDYLVGRTDMPITNLSDDELELLLDYRDCAKDSYKEKILKRASDLSIASLNGSSVAADEPLKNTGTTNTGK